MVRGSVFARVEDHVRGDAKFPSGTDAGSDTTDRRSVGLPLPQYSCIQPKTTGRSYSEGRLAGRVIVFSPR